MSCFVACPGAMTEPALVEAETPEKQQEGEKK
jgi:hypothetical protein